ncbi:MAG TPA: DUF4338 domain-containing protein [Bryobacteraceae bacterium]|nr:DUF4338 domain-containing protein [Bryobacteraceae bacterium]
MLVAEGAWFRYRGRELTGADIEFIRQLIAAHPGASRRGLSVKLCEAWQLRQPNGRLRDMVCRSMLLMLERAGAIELPPARGHYDPGVQRRKRPPAVVPDNRPIAGPLRRLLPIAMEQVRRTPREALFDSLMEQYHYLHYERPVGENVKYLMSVDGQAIACAAWSSAPRHLGARDRFIGWSSEARRRNIRFIAYNSRFLILPWARIPHLASHLLARMAAQIARDWEQMYAHPVHLLETFVDPQRFDGTCYRAANWQVLGMTTGRGKNNPHKKANRSIKQLLAYPLHRRFRELLGGGNG